jgi:tetratricopeptide (TPR) repeat protein
VAIADKLGRPNRSAEFNLGVTELELGRLAAAAKTFSTALAHDATQSTNSSAESQSATFLAVVWVMQGDYTRARPMLLRGVEVARRSGSPSLSTALSHAVRLAIHDGDRAKAHALLDEALKIPASNIPLRTLAAAELMRADSGCGAARPSLQHALDLAVAEDWHYVQTMAIMDLAECELELHDSKGARARLEAQLARLAKDGADDAALAPGRALLAKLH